MPQEMARVCKPDGRILLLEHGKANPEWLNRILNEGAHKHLMKWGCEWNRDIESIVKEVRFTNAHSLQAFLELISAV